jgi:predicted hydrocarbon binding protein
MFVPLLKLSSRVLTQNSAREDRVSTKERKASGLFYPNKIARIFLEAMEDVMGENGLKAILNLANLSNYIGKFPPDNLEREFDFADFTALQIALEDMYGPRGGRGLALRAGRACFAQGLKNFGALAGAGDLAFKVLPLPAKLKMGLPAMASIFTNFSDQISVVEEHDDHFTYIIKRCPLCWERTQQDKPVGHTAVGLLQEGLRWVSGGLEFRVIETDCKAKGDENGVFVVYKEPIG